MTPAQFDALTALRGLGDSATNRALRMVLVDGLSQSEAGQRCGVGRATVSNAAKAAARAVEFARVVAGTAAGNKTVQ
jgi:predicted DNA-binding protein (UPF0251 family)